MEQTKDRRMWVCDWKPPQETIWKDLPVGTYTPELRRPLFMMEVVDEGVFFWNVGEFPLERVQVSFGGFQTVGDEVMVRGGVLPVYDYADVQPGEVTCTPTLIQ